MKLATRQTNTKVGGNTEAPRTFNINANDVAFGVLSSGLYNDKIRAIVRELSCNAWDAHVMAGKKDQPFEVHLPTDFEPYFSIKDFGTGLSHDDVMSLYCTYFASNKNHSNDVVGAMGLGSKSPFCYTQAQDEQQGFTVTSRFGGTKRIYSAYVDNGAPTIVCLSEEESDEPNGLEVQFAVNTDDVWEFENKAKKALEFFSPAPVVNIEGFEADQQDYAIRTALWAVRKDESGIDGVRAIQGMVQYSVGSIDVSRMTPEQQKVSQMPLDLFFPIGELSVAASRETLSNDQRTINNILKMYTKVYEGMVEEIRKNLNNCKYAWMARLELMKVLHSDLGELIQSAYDRGAFDGKYDNFTLTRDTPSLYEFDYKVMQVLKYSRRGRKYASRDQLFTKRNPNDRQLALDEIAKEPKVKKNFLRELEVEKHVVFIVNDLDNRGANKYIQAYVQGRDDKNEPYCQTAYVFTPMNGKHQMKRMQKELKKALNEIGNPPVIMVSWLKQNFQHLVDAMRPTPKPRITGILKLTGDGVSYRNRRSSNSGWQKKTWSVVPEAQLPTGTKWYVPVEEKKVTQLSFGYAEEFVDLINAVRMSKLFPGIVMGTPVFALTQKAIDKLQKNGDTDWVNALDYICDNVQTCIPDSKVLELSIYISPFECPHEEILKAVLKNEADFAGSPLIEFGKSYFAVKGKKKEENAGHITTIINIMSKFKKYKKGETLNFETMWSQIVKERYPVLGLGFSRYNYGGVHVPYEKTVVEYIKLVDSQRKAEGL